MLGRKTLLVNPPLVNGIAFTRQGRCQEREEVLGTTKPPYTLAVLGSLLRNAGCEVVLADLTAERQTVEELTARLHAQVGLPSARVKVCRGRLFSPRDYVTDITEWGFADVVGKGLEERHEPIA